MNKTGMAEAQRTQHYTTLLGKIDDLSSRQHETFGEEIRCQKGCDSCCRPPDSLFLIEVETLQKGLRGLHEDARVLVKQQLEAYKTNVREMCPMLHEGGCMVYEARPSICRTHGYAIFWREEEKLSWCPLNFTDVTPEKDDAFDIERLNQMLSLVTQLSWPSEEARRDLVEVIEEALGEAEGMER